MGGATPTREGGQVTVSVVTCPTAPIIVEPAIAAPQGKVLAAKPQREYADTASLPEIDRRLRLRVLAEGEHLLPTNELRAVTLARMQALLQMNRELPHEAMTRIVDSFEAVMDQIPGRLAMRCVEMVLTLVREFTLAEQERLRRLVPGVLKPRPVNDYGGRRLASRQHPTWTFWKR